MRGTVFIQSIYYLVGCCQIEPKIRRCLPFIHRVVFKIGIDFEWGNVKGSIFFFF